MTKSKNKELLIPRMSTVEKRALLTWTFDTFTPLTFYSFDDFLEALLDSPHAGLSDGVRICDSDMFSYILLFRMKKSVPRKLYRDQFPDHYISMCGWKPINLEVPEVVPERDARRPGGAHPQRKGQPKRLDQWEYPTGFMWGPVAHFSKKKEREPVAPYDPNDEDDDSDSHSAPLEQATDQTTKLDLIISGMRAAQWGRVKGELRTMVDVGGCTTPSRPVGTAPGYVAKWETLEERVEKFIADIENDGLHE